MFYSQWRSRFLFLLVCGIVSLGTACTQTASTEQNGANSDSQTEASATQSETEPSEATESSLTEEKAETSEKAEATEESTEKAEETADNSETKATETFAPGTGKLTGEVRWNSKGAENLEVKLCENLTLIGCSGQEFNGRTDDGGKFSFADVPSGQYSVAVRVFETDLWMYPTSGPITASEFEVKAGEVLEVSTLNIHKSLLLNNPTSEQTIAEKSPTLVWQEIPEASYYEVYLSAEKNFAPYESAITNLKVEENEYVVPKELAKCRYTWRIEAFNTDGVIIARSDFGKFSIQGCQAPSDS
ncbi:MAG: carboxypeptidase-like regulatory domain-containing protein [Cyanobacteria bacterium P01_E01_bin.42]